MADPTLIAEIAFTTDPFSTPSWTDVTADVDAFTVRRGKARLFGQIPAGQATVTLDDPDGKYDPNNSGSPYDGNVLPMRRLRLRASVDSYSDTYSDEYGDVYGLFSGFITAWPQEYQHPDMQRVTIEAVDGFYILNLRRLSTSYSQELSGARIGNVLDDVSWPAADRNLDAGQTTVQNVTLDADNPLGHLATVAQTEAGLAYIDRDGNFRFISRHGLAEALFDDANYTFGDATGDIAYAADITPDFDDTEIWNDVRVSSQGVAEQTAEDATSQGSYLTRTLERSGLLHISTAAQQSHATHLLVGFAEPTQLVEQVTHDAVHTDVEWGRILDRDLGAKVRIRRSPPGGGTITIRSFVEGISWNVAGHVWRCKWQLIPTTRRTDFWLAGDAVQSLGGISTRGGW